MKIHHAVALIVMSLPAVLLAGTDAAAWQYHCSDGSPHQEAGDWRCPDGTLAVPIFGAHQHHATMGASVADYPLKLDVGGGEKGGSLLRVPSVEDLSRSVTRSTLEHF